MYLPSQIGGKMWKEGETSSKIRPSQGFLHVLQVTGGPLGYSVSGLGFSEENAFNILRVPYFQETSCTMGCKPYLYSFPSKGRYKAN